MTTPERWALLAAAGGAAALLYKARKDCTAHTCRMSSARQLSCAAAASSRPPPLPPAAHRRSLARPPSPPAAVGHRPAAHAGRAERAAGRAGLLGARRALPRPAPLAGRQQQPAAGGAGPARPHWQHPPHPAGQPVGTDGLRGGWTSDELASADRLQPLPAVHMHLAGHHQLPTAGRRLLTSACSCLLLSPLSSSIPPHIRS